MPLTASDALFRLIHSLSRTEKGYVKKYCSRHVIGDGNDYLRLFDVIEAQQTYSESDVKAALHGTAMVRRLPAVKNYLYQQILEAMRAYHAASSSERRIVELLEDADFLWEKTLYDQAMKRVEKAREIARSHDEFAFWLKTLSWEKNYRHVILERPLTDGTEDALSREQHRVMELLRNTVDYENLGNTLHDNLIRMSQGNTAATAWLKKLPDHPLLQSPDSAVSRPAQLNYHLILANWWSFVGNDAPKAVEYSRALVHIIQADTELREARPDTYLGILYSHLINLAQAGNHDEFSTTISLLWDERSKQPTKNIEVKRFYRAVNAECTYALECGVTDRLAERMPYIKERYDALADYIPPQSRVAMCFMCGRFSYTIGALRDSAWWFRRLAMCDESVRPDMHAAARLLQLKKAMDDRDVDYVRTSARSLQRFLKSRGLHSARTDAVLSFFRRFAESHGAKRKTLLAETARRLTSAAVASPFDPVRTSGLDVWIAKAAPSMAANLEAPFNT